MKTIEVEMMTQIKYKVSSTDHLTMLDTDADLELFCDYEEVLEAEDVKNEYTEFKKVGDILYVFHYLIFELNVNDVMLEKIKRKEYVKSKLCDKIKDDLYFILEQDPSSDAYIDIPNTFTQLTDHTSTYRYLVD